jgi:hypothetical protein
MTVSKIAFLAITITVLSLFLAPRHSLGQTATFSFDDLDGQADAGTYPAGATFTLSISLSFGPGGNVTNLAGLSYWFEQQSSLPPFNFAITNRDVTGSAFTFLQTPGLSYPQALVPSNKKDLGAQTASGTGVGAGTYFISNVTFSIDPSSTPGTYIIENTTTQAKTSVISDDLGHIFAIPHASYTVTIVPFAITAISQLDNQHILLQCEGVPNAANHIQASPDLSPNSFQTIESVTPDATGAFSFEDTNPGTFRFYRLAYP